jgi:hypothetical protein
MVRSALIACLVLLACGCDGSDPAPAQGVAADSFTVGPAGGAFTAADGRVVLFFPAGAVTGDVLITVTPTDPPASTGFLAGACYEFEPGMDFLQPVDLTIAYDPAAVVGDAADLRLAKFVDEGDVRHQLWPSGSVDTANHTVTGHIRGFSLHGAVDGRTTAPPVPPMLSAEVNEDRTITLTWTPTPCALVRIERSRAITGGAACAPHPSRPWCIQTPDGPQLNGLQPPTEADFAPGTGASSFLRGADLGTVTVSGGGAGVYYFRARAVCDSTASAPSPLVRVILLGPTLPPPTPPARFSATAYPCGGVALRWSSVLEASSYRIERAAGGPFEVVANVIGTVLFHVDTSGDPGSEYAYRIRSENSAGISQPSPHVTVTNADTGFTLRLSDYRTAALPGESVEIDVLLDWHVAPEDVEFDAVFASTRVSAAFDPGTSDNGSKLTLTVAEDAPEGLRIPIDVTGTVAAGTSCAIPILLTVAAPPPPSGLSLDSISPSVIAANSPDSVKLTGSGFAEGARVLLNGNEIASTVMSDVEILMHLADGLPAGSYEVKVVNPDGSESNTQQLFVV